MYTPSRTRPDNSSWLRGTDTPPPLTRADNSSWVRGTEAPAGIPIESLSFVSWGFAGVDVGFGTLGIFDGGVVA